MNSRKKLVCTMFLMIVLLGLIAACGTPTASSPTPAAKGAPPSAGAQTTPGRPGGTQPTPGRAAPTPTRAIQVVVTKAKVAGNIIAANQASLTFATSGRLKELPVPEGTRVKAGTLLAALDTATLEIQVAQAKAAFDLATANWNRIQAGPSADEIALAKSNVDRAKAAVDQAYSAYEAIGGLRNPRIAMMPQSSALQQATLSYQIAVAQYNLTVNHPTDSERAVGLAQFAQAQAAYDAAKQSLSNARIVAPYDGTLVSITPKIGESINANAPVLLFADLTQMQVLTAIDETTLASVKVGQKATLFADAAPDQALTGRVKRIGLFATSVGNIVTVPVWIDIDKTDAPLAPGWSATVEIATTP
ncbi:MAG: HlyD family efflux transporter periplasmic adaptor subunit [Chloroflexota bacterium]